MFRFIHTADWQLGARFAQFSARATHLREARLATLKRTLDLAVQQEADAFLIAGDLFEDKDRTPENLATMTNAVDAFFAWEANDERLRLLSVSTTPEVIAAKHALLEELRKQNVFVLSRGAIEEYYTPSIVGGEKPARAQQFRREITTKEAILACCDNLPHLDGTCSEFELILKPIFS